MRVVIHLERHSDFNSFSFPVDFPESDVLFVSKFFHAPRGLSSALPLSRLGIVQTSSALLSLLARFKACSEVHRNEQSDLEPLDELSATKGIAILASLR